MELSKGWVEEYSGWNPMSMVATDDGSGDIDVL